MEDTNQLLTGMVLQVPEDILEGGENLLQF